MQKPENVDPADWQQLQSALFSTINSSNYNVEAVNDESKVSGGVPSTEELGNQQNIEYEWAAKAGKYAETHWKLLGLYTKVNTPDSTEAAEQQQIQKLKTFRLTANDDEIYRHFRTMFPVEHLNISYLTDNKLKNDKAKAKWREFCNKYEQSSIIKDFNFGTLLRLNAHKSYDDPDNVTIVPRIQFFAIEIARNREGVNINFEE